MFTHTLTVRFRDLDAMDHVNNATYLTYLEEARLGFSSDMGINWARFREEGFVIARCEIDYRRPALLGDTLNIELWVSEIGRTRSSSGTASLDPATGKSSPKPKQCRCATMPCAIARSGCPNDGVRTWRATRIGQPTFQRPDRMRFWAWNPLTRQPSDETITSACVARARRWHAWPGFGFGAMGETTGEVVFNTSMTGYQEILTDPSYHGQIVAMTVPHIGNIGVNPEDDESRTRLGAPASSCATLSPRRQQLPRARSRWTIT